MKVGGGIAEEQGWGGKEWEGGTVKKAAQPYHVSEGNHHTTASKILHKIVSEIH